MNQRYISNELTHFVGRGKTEEEQFEVLCTILKERELRAGFTLPGDDRAQLHNLGSPSTVMVGPLDSGDLMDEKMVTTSKVCFCDIPIADLGVHMKKFSRFGIAFMKQFLVGRGACPVFYVPKNALVGPRKEPLRDIFGRMSAELNALGQSLMMSDFHSTNPELFKRLMMLRSDVKARILSFIKPFTYADNLADLQNTYTEREWCTLNSVRFVLDDVERIILPRRFADGFRNKFPEYSAQLEYADAHLAPTREST